MNVVRGGLLVLLASSTMARVARTTHLRTVPARGREEGRAKSVTNLEVVTETVQLQVCAQSRHIGGRECTGAEVHGRGPGKPDGQGW